MFLADIYTERYTTTKIYTDASFNVSKSSLVSRLCIISDLNLEVLHSFLLGSPTVFDPA